MIKRGLLLLIVLFFTVSVVYAENDEGSGFLCWESEDCVNDMMVCGSNGQCERSISCNTDPDCDSGENCVGILGRRNSVCHWRCSSNDDCSVVGTECRVGRCRRVRCDDTRDCQSGNVCSNNVCQGIQDDPLEWQPGGRRCDNDNVCLPYGKI